MNVQSLALAYSRGIDDLTQLVGDIDRAREPVRAELDEIERSPQEQRYKTIARYEQLRVQLRNMTATRMDVVNARASLRARRDELDPDLIRRMAGEVAGAFAASERRSKGCESESET